MNASITAKLAKNLIELAKNAYPNEVGGILLGRPTANDFVLFPGRFSSNSVSFNTFDIPFYSNVAGTFHSHPNSNLRPSSADLQMFQKFGAFHIIFGMNQFACYDSYGKLLKLEIKQ